MAVSSGRSLGIANLPHFDEREVLPRARIDVAFPPRRFKLCRFLRLDESQSGHQVLSLSTRHDTATLPSSRILGNVMTARGHPLPHHFLARGARTRAAATDAGRMQLVNGGPATRFPVLS